MGKAWQGRFSEPTDRRVERFTESISFDRRLYREDVAASIAHATMLAEVGLLTGEERDALQEALREIEGEIERGEFPFDIADEDIHLAIERRLIERIGDAGRKLHTARSRNDQVATDLKLWTRAALDRIDQALAEMQRALLGLATRHVATVIPAYTHLQRAQPVLAAHQLLAHVEKLQRDRLRVADCRRRVNVLPLGTAAGAGTSLPIDRDRVAGLLGFEEIAANSLDVSSDRDFVAETLFVCVMIAEHLSAWAEEWVLWSTTEFGFLRLPDGFCTGSSIMPHKKNPDVLELIRGKTGRVVGALQTVLVLIKGLPLAYNRDLQEDKPALFDAIDTVEACLDLGAALVAEADLRVDRIAEGLDEGFLDATTLMERLIAAGVPMRSAHEAVGRLVRDAIDRRVALADLPAQAFEEIAPGRGAELRSQMGAGPALESFVSVGSTGPQRVHEQLGRWKDRLG